MRHRFSLGACERWNVSTHTPFLQQTRLRQRALRCTHPVPDSVSSAELCKSLKTGNGNWLQFETDRTSKLVNYLIWPEGWGEWPYRCVVVCADNFTVRNLRSRVPDNKVSGWE